MAKKTLVLTIRVTYDLNGEPVEYMKNTLRYIATNAAGNGLMTGPTAAEVDSWNMTITEEK